VIILLVVVLFCLAVFMTLPHAAKGFSWLFEHLSIFAVSFSNQSKEFSGWLEKKSHYMYNSSVSAVDDIVFLRSLQPHEKNLLRLMREGKLKNPPHLQALLEAAEKKATELQAKLATTETHATELQAKLATTEKHAIDLEAKLATSEKNANELKGKLATAVKLSTDLQAKLKRGGKHAAELQAQLDKALQDYGCLKFAEDFSSAFSKVSNIFLQSPWEE
jgi:hypothetical protein